MEISDITGRIATVLKSDNVQAKRNIISTLGSNLIFDDKNLIIINRKEVEALISGVKRFKSTYPKFEPNLSLIEQGLNEKSSLKRDDFSIMLRTWDDVRLAIIEENKQI
jgi:hypothetical protein